MLSIASYLTCAITVPLQVRIFHTCFTYYMTYLRTAGRHAAVAPAGMGPAAAAAAGTHPTAVSLQQPLCQQSIQYMSASTTPTCWHTDILSVFVSMKP